jgi:VPDSG-CTERM motif
MKIKSLLITTLAVAGLAQVASAIPFPSTFGLYIYDTATGTSKYVAIVGGTASYNGAVGDYTVAISTGITINGGGNPAIDLDVAQATAGAGATSLQIFYSDGGFGPSSGIYTLNTYLGTGGPVTTSGYLSAANTPFGQTTLLGGSADVVGANVVNATGSLSGVQNPYSLTIADVITGTVTSMDSKLSVPDGGSTVMLLGMALSGAALLKRKFVA